MADDGVNSSVSVCGSPHCGVGGPSLADRGPPSSCGPPDGPPASGGETPRLSDLLTDGWRLYEEVESSAEPGGSSPVQRKVRLGLGKLEEATRMVSQLDLFSRNEDLEEVSTADLRYLLLPALQGALTMRLSERAKRLEAVRAARAHFYDFLRRCKEYNVSKFTMPKTSTIEEEEEEEEEGEEEGEGSGGGSVVTKASSSAAAPRGPDLVAMASQRQAKIERYRQRKETEARIADMKEAVEAGRAEDETVREYYLLHVRRWVCVALEEIQSIDEEMEILKRMGSLSHGGGGPPHGGGGPPRAPMKPFILTKDAVQARVFGAGYPSLPTLSVDEWYEQHLQRGALPDQGVASRAPPPRGRDGADLDQSELEEEQKEKRAEEEDREALQKARDWDNWKDSHQRGYGNRKNMG